MPRMVRILTTLIGFWSVMLPASWLLAPVALLPVVAAGAAYVAIELIGAAARRTTPTPRRRAPLPTPAPAVVELARVTDLAELRARRAAASGAERAPLRRAA